MPPHVTETKVVVVVASISSSSRHCGSFFGVSVFGAIAVCLFPLWPPEVRLGVYYLSVAAACFVGLIFALCIGTFEIGLSLS